MDVRSGLIPPFTSLLHLGPPSLSFSKWSWLQQKMWCFHLTKWRGRHPLQEEKKREENKSSRDMLEEVQKGGRKYPREDVEGVFSLCLWITVTHSLHKDSQHFAPKFVLHQCLDGKGSSFPSHRAMRSLLGWAQPAVKWFRPCNLAFSPFSGAHLHKILRTLLYPLLCLPPPLFLQKSVPVRLLK